MAECPSSAEQALEKLNEQLTCPICLDQYTDPKLLHCFHVFCEKCLKPVARQTPQGQVVECPNCRHLTSLPQEGVSGLQGAFLIHHLLDIQDILNKVSTPAGTKCVKCKKRDPTCYCRSCGFLCESCKKPHVEWDEFASHELVSLNQLTKDATNLMTPVQKTLNCSKHPAKELDLYCETCQEVICHYCVLKLHRDHQYDLATDAFLQQKKVLISSVEPVEQQLVSVNKALEDLKSLSGEITSQRQALETKIRADIRLCHQALEAREKVLISRLDQMTREKLKNVTVQQDQLELVATRLKSCCGFLQESLRTGSQVEILAMGKPFVQQVKDVTSSFKPKSLESEEAADMVFLSNQKELSQACQQFGQVVTSNICHEKCSAEGDGLQLAVVGETATATVQVVDQKGREYRHQVEVNCEVVSSDGSSQVRGKAKKVRDGQYKISYLPQHRGLHHLHIKVGGKHISGSPFSLSVITTTPTKVLAGVAFPWGQAVYNEEVIVVENARGCLSLFSSNGNKRESFGSIGSLPGQLNLPCGLAIFSTGVLLVTDQQNHRIQTFSRNGKSLQCVGTEGNGKLEFNCPLVAAIHPQSKKVYVVDTGNKRIQILNNDLTFFDIFGSDSIQEPIAVSFDSTGNVYVTDSKEHRVKVFTESGESCRQFGNYGSGKGELNQPTGIAIDANDIVYVTEWGNHRISLFTREGYFLESIGRHGKQPGQFSGPTGIFVSKSGIIYASDSGNARVQVF